MVFGENQMKGSARRSGLNKIVFVDDFTFEDSPDFWESLQSGHTKYQQPNSVLLRLRNSPGAVSMCVRLLLPFSPDSI